MEWIKIFCYIFATYGMTVIVTQSVGPFEVFVRLRMWAESVSDNFGMLFRCALCFPTNVGWVLSLLNWFFIPLALTPFNIILDGTDYWWLAAILDGAFTGAVCKIIFNIDDFIDKSTPPTEEYVGDDEQQMLLD